MNTHACARPNVTNMDHVVGQFPDLRAMVNRMCLGCGTHWYGDAGVAVFEMPRKVWDGVIDAGSPRATSPRRSCGSCAHFSGDKCHSAEYADYPDFPREVSPRQLCENHKRPEDLA